MSDQTAYFSHLRRPRILISAARHGVPEYRRNLHLARLLGSGSLPHGTGTLHQLLEIEADLERQRRVDDAVYPLSRHIDVWIALLAEAQLIRRAQTTQVS